MSILMRNDSTQFVIQAYRELLTDVRKRLFNCLVRKAAKQHGQYVCILSKNINTYEVAFSHTPGYLLGESIKRYFNEAENLIFCEELPNKKEILVVVVRMGSVCIDTLIPVSKLHEIIIPLTYKQNSFYVVTSGNVPLKKDNTTIGFNLPSSKVIYFEILSKPLLPRLPILKSLQLVPVSLALKSNSLDSFLKAFTTLLVLVSMGFFCYWILATQNLYSHLYKHHITNSYAFYKRALSTPAPEKQLDEFVEIVQALYNLPGWQATTIIYSNKLYTVKVDDNGGNLEVLNAWTKASGFNLRLKPHAVILTKTSSLQSRLSPKIIYSHQGLVGTLIDQLNEILLAPSSVSVQEIIMHGNIQETTLSITVENASIQLFEIIGETLKGLPVTVNSLSITIKSDAITGTIKFSVWGT